jgi:phage baseplate assembly protein W
MADAKKYDFNSVGETETSYRSRTKANDVSVPVGIKTPLEIGIGSDTLFKTHKNLEDTIADNFRNLILTNHGERMFRHDYGANLREIAFELGTEEGDYEAINRIRASVRKYLPFLNLQTFESFQVAQTYTDPAKVGIRITYNVPGYNAKQRVLEVIISTVS